MLKRPMLTTSALALLTALSMGTSAAFAQTAPAQTASTSPAPAPQDGDEEEETAVEEVVVQVARPDIISATDRMIYNITNDLQAQTGSVADALRNVPGVEVDLQGNVSLRGDSNVTILIDGRPSGMLRGSGRADALQAMSAGTIERVEVITNPSAAFSPEGSGGIINLVSKPTRAAVSVGSVRASWDGGERGNASLSGSRTQDGLTLAGDLGFRRETRESASESSRIRPGATPATTSLEEGASEGENSVESVNARVSADYDLNPQNRVSGELSWRNFDVTSINAETLIRADGNGLASYAYDRASDSGFSNTGLSARTSWRRKFTGDQHELVADLEYDSNESDRLTEAFTDNVIGAAPDYFERIRGLNQRDAYGFKLDYTRPMGEGRTLKVGYEGDLSQDTFDSSGVRGFTTSTLLPVAALTNLFEFDQTIHAAYATYERPFGELTAQFGLRAEQVEFELNQITDAITAEQDYFRLYPTLNLAYQLTDTQRLRGSYSRRVQRPSPQDLNPYTIYVDPQNLRRGNPDLEPETTDSFEVAWQTRVGQTFYAATAFYRTSEGGVTDVVQDLGGGVVLSTRENLGSSERMGVEFIANGKLGDQVSYNASGSIYRNDISTPGFGSQSGTTGTVRASVNWQPTPQDFFQLNGFYIGEQVQAQGSREPFGLLNIGYRRKLNDDFSIVLTGTNILDTAEQRVRTDAATFSDRTRVRFGEPVYYIGLTYTFGGGPRRPEPAFDFGGQAAGGPG
ncbi:TonB-dependent receptor [Rhizobium sp. CRIBSB]|nr:TonB-dependent receptor [Rhizobium sp. CRIBSB]